MGLEKEICVSEEKEGGSDGSNWKAKKHHIKVPVLETLTGSVFIKLKKSSSSL